MLSIIAVLKLLVNTSNLLFYILAKMISYLHNIKYIIIVIIVLNNLLGHFIFYIFHIEFLNNSFILGIVY